MRKHVPQLQQNDAVRSLLLDPAQRMLAPWSFLRQSLPKGITCFPSRLPRRQEGHVGIDDRLEDDGTVGGERFAPGSGNVLWMFDADAGKAE